MEPVIQFGERWRRVRLDENAEADVREFLDARFAGLPAEQAESVRGVLAAGFADQIMAARAKSGLNLYFLADPAQHAVVLAAAVTIPTAVVPDPAAVVARVAESNPAARTGLVAGMPAVRIDHSLLSEDAEDEDEQGVAAPRHIEYVIPMAGDPSHRWLSLALTVQAVENGVRPEETVAEFDQAVAAMEWAAPGR